MMFYVGEVCYKYLDSVIIPHEKEYNITILGLNRDGKVCFFKHDQVRFNV